MRRKWVFVVLLLILAGTIGWLGWRGARAASQARLAWADLQRIQAIANDPTPVALPALRADLAALEGHLQMAQEAASPFLWLAPRLGWLPKVGPTVAAAPTLLQMATELTSAGRIALDALLPLAERIGQAQGSTALAEAVQGLAAAAQDLAQANAHLAQAEVLASSLAGPLPGQLTAQLERLERLLPLARLGLAAAQVAPSLLGVDRPRTYLILAQNNHELRATGGFISSVGIVRLEGGRISDFRLSDSYAVDDLRQPHPQPPPSLREQMGIQLLLLRDSNWSPDFPAAAQVARALYEQDQGVTTDGAIALDLEAVRLLVEALGPLQVPEMAGEVTGANVMEWMKEAWERPATSSGTVAEAGSSDWWGKRKDFMAALAVSILGRLEEARELDFVALAKALVAMLDGRHLQISVDDPVAAELLASQNWDGALRPPEEGDFLALVDSNVGYNKANAAVQQEIAYQVFSVGDRLEATLTLTYTHIAPSLPPDQPCDRTPRYGDSYDELIRRCYWDYLRVYVPAASELLTASGLEHLTTEPGEQATTVFAGDFVLRPGDRHTVTLHYRLPAVLSASPYRLMVRKQAGTMALPLSVQVPGCHWETDLARDRVFICEAGAP